MNRPRLLDLFCGAGGAAMGYHRAGFDVTGVDIAPQPRYPFPFVQADAMTFPLEGFDAIHASPPCQDYSRAMRHLTTRHYPRLIEPMLERLADRVYIVENVPGAPLPHQSTLDGDHGVELCGTMFGLLIWRHRLFQTSFLISAPRGCAHVSAPVNRNRGNRPGGRSTNRAWREAIGVTWMSNQETDESIPPAYTYYIGTKLMSEFPAQEPAARGSGSVGG
jgi:DNA (cytosine-5)-methyltransferase 1